MATLTRASAYRQYYTTAQTVTLPDATTLSVGWPFQIFNNSVGNITVADASGNTVQTITTITVLTVICTSSSTKNGTWQTIYSTQGVGAGGTVTSVDMTVPAFLSVSGNPVTTSGTLAVTLSGTALPIANGGTAGTSATTAFNNLSPVTSTGDLILGNGANSNTRLGIGANNTALTSNGTTASWNLIANANFATMANNTVKGNKSGGALAPSDLALSDVAESGSGIVTIANGTKAIIGASNLTLQYNLANGSIYVGNASNYPVAVAVSGDLTAVNTGAFTVAKIQSTTVTGTTGTGNVVFDNAPTFAGAVNMGSHKITSVTDPTSAQDAATKNYVDTVASGLTPQEGCYAASTANIPNTYSNGVAGVGATITVTATGALSLDGTLPAINSRVLIKNQTNGFENGIYSVTLVGSLGVSPILTRALNYNTANDIDAGDLIAVENGTVNALTTWVQTANVTTVGSDSLVFTKFSINPSNVLTTALTSAHLLVGNSSNIATDVAVSGDLTAANTGAFTVAKIQTTTVSGTTGTTNVVFSASPTLTGTIAAAALTLTTPLGPTYGGTNQSSYTTGDTLYASASNTLSKLGIGTQYQVLQANATVVAFDAVHLDQSAAVTGILPNANTTAVSTNTASKIVTRDGSGNFSAGTITAALTGTASGNVTSVAMTVPTFLSISGSPITTSGTLAVTLSGTALPIANGGTAVTSVTTTPAATTFAGWDASSNLSGNNLIKNYTTTATAAATTTLTVASSGLQYFTGSTTQNLVLPDATTLPRTGFQFYVVNLSTGTVTVKDNGSNTLNTIVGGANAWITAKSIGTSNGSWDFQITTNNAGGGTVTSVTFTGDGTVLSSTPSAAVTTSGTLTAALANQSANVVLAGPSSGAAAAPTFRALVRADLGQGVIGRLAYRSVTGTDSASNTTDDVLILSSSSFTETLPTAVGVAGKVFYLIHNGTSITNIYTLNTTSSQTIGGIASGSYKLVTVGEELAVVSDGTNWQILYHVAETDWVNGGAITITGTTSNPTKPSGLTVDKFYWRRAGKELRVRMSYTQSNTTSAAAGSGDYLFTVIPSGLTIDNTQLTFYTTVAGTSPSNTVGNFLGGNGTTLMTGNAIAYSTTQIRIQYIDTTATSWLGSAKYPLTNASTLSFQANLQVPITEFQP